MKRIFAAALLLLCLPMTKTQMIRRIRCQSPQYTYEELMVLPENALRSMLEPGV